MAENKKSLAVNSFFSVFYKLLNVLFPLITSVYTARILLADGIGKVAYAQNIVQYFVVIAALGIPNYGIREIAKNQKSQDETNKVFSELFIINFISTTACIVTYYILVLCEPFFIIYKDLHLIVGITLVLNYLNVDWYYQGKEEYGFIAFRNLVVKAVSLVALVVFVRDKNDFSIYALITCLAVAGNNIINVINLRGRVKLILGKLALSRHMKPVLILLASSISIELYTLLDTTMLGNVCSDEIVGYYTNAVKLARIINSSISSIALVLLPRLSYYYSIGENEELSKIANRVLKILVTLTLPASIGVFFLSNDIIPLLFGYDFEPAVLTLRILSILVIAVALNNFFGTQILMTFCQEKKLLISVICGAVVNLILNSVLIPLWANDGAAVASAISETVVLFVTFMFSKRFIKFKLNSHYIVTLLISITIMSISLFVCKSFSLSSFWEMCLGIVIGLTVFFSAGIFLKNEGIIDIISVVKRLLNKGKNKILRVLRKT